MDKTREEALHLFGVFNIIVPLLGLQFNQLFYVIVHTTLLSFFFGFKPTLTRQHDIQMNNDRTSSPPS